ncbi:MAG: PLDc N-terminal domain-containing protein [Planctomycetaceae bacterium]|jgi:hypothetical protein|nr:PLDc N-terminal domain-containing protein [Planctomycetaceae bacterium]MDG2388237.1 PLDc N-terminal domain-containing protein [Planctomycetaceae bacterium]
MDFVLLTAIYSAIEILGVLTAFHNVMRTRTPPGAVAWCFALVLFPIVSLPFYWIFGRNKFAGYVVSRQQGDLEIQQQVALGLERFAKDLEGMLNADFENSREMETGELSRKPFLFQLACQVSRLMAPIQ